MTLAADKNSPFEGIADPGLRSRMEAGMEQGRSSMPGYKFAARELSIIRMFDADVINEIVNHPAVKPWIASPDFQTIDLSDAVANLNNVLLMTDGGGFLFLKREPGMYEVHAQFHPNFRGKKVVQAATDAAHWMFTRTDCVEIYTRVPDGNVPAAALTRCAKAEFLFHTSNAWPSPAGPVGVRHFWRTYQAWIRDADYLAQFGQQFHETLKSARSRSVADQPARQYDCDHGRYVGALCEMVAGGQPLKGIAIYNRWAMLTGYLPAAVVSDNPIVIDLHDAVIAAKPDGIEVLLCR